MASIGYEVGKDFGERLDRGNDRSVVKIKLRDREFVPLIMSGINYRDKERGMQTYSVWFFSQRGEQQIGEDPSYALRVLTGALFSSCYGFALEPEKGEPVFCGEAQVTINRKGDSSQVLITSRTDRDLALTSGAIQELSGVRLEKILN